jgi:hypothetical protein
MHPLDAMNEHWFDLGVAAKWLGLPPRTAWAVIRAFAAQEMDADVVEDLGPERLWILGQVMRLPAFRQLRRAHRPGRRRGAPDRPPAPGQRPTGPGDPGGGPDPGTPRDDARHRARTSIDHVLDDTEAILRRFGILLQPEPEDQESEVDSHER